MPDKPSAIKATIRVIFFDAVGTLIHLPRGVGYHYGLVAQRHGGQVSEEAWNAAFRRVWNEMPAPAVSNAPRADDDRGWWRELVGRVLDACLPSGDGFDREAYFEELYAHFAQPGVWSLYPESAAVLECLSSEHRLAIISNFDRRLRAILDQLGIARRFQQIIISSEVGADKPDPFIFQHAMKLMDVRPEEAVHVGDEPAGDWHGAERADMHCFRLDRARNSLDELPGFIRALTASRGS